MADLKPPPGGKKTPAPIAERIPTPDALDTEAVMAAVRAAEAEKQRAAALRRSHKNDCPELRAGECNCPANLRQLPPALETVKPNAPRFEHLKLVASKLEERFLAGERVGDELQDAKRKALEFAKHADIEVVRVDNGKLVERERPNPISKNSKPIRMTEELPPRWICTSCGWSIRGVGVDAHICDPSALLWKARPLSLVLTISPDKRWNGGFRLSIWRDVAGRYHLSEQILDGDRVIEDREVLVEDFYPAIEGALNDKLVEDFSP